MEILSAVVGILLVVYLVIPFSTIGVLFMVMVLMVGHKKAITTVKKLLKQKY